MGTLIARAIDYLQAVGPGDLLGGFLTFAAVLAALVYLGTV
jgi:hypothetical protein